MECRFAKFRKRSETTVVLLSEWGSEASMRGSSIRGVEANCKAARDPILRFGPESE